LIGDHEFVRRFHARSCGVGAVDIQLRDGMRLRCSRSVRITSCVALSVIG
jgi:hypothetical protein